jgi:hypothetical protein
MLMTPGAAGMRIEKPPYARRHKALFPLDPDAAFSI